jgi:hypothetical protein
MGQSVVEGREDDVLQNGIEDFGVDAGCMERLGRVARVGGKVLDRQEAADFGAQILVLQNRRHRLGFFSAYTLGHLQSHMSGSLTGKLTQTWFEDVPGSFGVFFVADIGLL